MKIYTVVSRCGCEMNAPSVHTTYEAAYVTMKQQFRNSLADYFNDCDNEDCTLFADVEETDNFADIPFETIPENLWGTHFCHSFERFYLEPYSATIVTTDEWEEWILTEHEIAVD